MEDFLILERFSWFHRQVQQKRYPNADGLAEKFGLSARVARRNIEYMQNFLGAPLVYDESKKGYHYNDSGFEIGRLQATQDELIAILLAQNLLTPSAGGIISKAISSFSEKLFSAAANIGLSEDRINEAFSATWYGYAPAPSDIFRIVSGALIQYRLLTINYMSPLDGEITERNVEPHHLQLYMGSWVLIAWCRMRHGWRKFYLSRVNEVKTLEESFHVRPKNEWQHLLDRVFGIFQGEKTVEVCIRFSPGRSRFVQEQVWHPKQKIKVLDDGAVELSLPVADFREIKFRILQFGSEATVLKPELLRQEVMKEINDMSNLYGNKNV